MTLEAHPFIFGLVTDWSRLQCQFPPVWVIHDGIVQVGDATQDHFTTHRAMELTQGLPWFLGRIEVTGDSHHSDFLCFFCLNRLAHFFTSQMASIICSSLSKGSVNVYPYLAIATVIMMT